MLNKIIDYVRNSNVVKYFLIGLIIAVIHVISGRFSIILFAACLSVLSTLLVHTPFLKEKMTYDQRHNAEINVLLLSSILWAIYMWKDLQDSPQAYTITFVVLCFSIFNLFNSLKKRLYLLLPITTIFVLLNLLIQFPTLIMVTSVTLIFLFLFLLNGAEQSFVKESTQTNEDQDFNKLEMVGELDEHKVENKKLTEQLKQAEINLSAAEMAKIEFLATMSHEIRTPLNGIIPLLDILLDSDLSDFQRDYLTTAHVSAIQMQKLIDDLLDYSKVESGKLTVETRGLKIPRIIDAVHSSFKKAAQVKNLKIKVNVNKNISPLLRGDPTRLRQVLSNLVSNAIKFSNYGTIQINAKKLKNYSHKEIVRFEVIDQGIGLDQQTSETIFLPFTQEDASSTRKFGGTGLGLAISKKIVELMQGYIYVESEKDKGSNFYFDLPLLKSVGETTIDTGEALDYQAILVNTSPLLFNNVVKKLKSEEMPFQKTLGLSQAYETFASINKVLTNKKNILVFIDFETAGKQARRLCQDIISDEQMSNLYACILSNNETIAGLPKSPNIKLLSKDFSLEKLLSTIEVSKVNVKTVETNEDINQIPNEDTSTNDESTTNLNKETPETANLIPEVLLVEDNEVNLKVAEKLIQYIGYPFDFAMNGQEALEKVKQNRYRMILMDCQMPVMDGYRATVKIRDYELAAGLNRTPILAMTANAMLGDKEKCLDSGMDDYMSKPLNRYILEKTLKKWDPLANSKPIDSPSIQELTVEKNEIKPDSAQQSKSKIIKQEKVNTVDEKPSNKPILNTLKNKQEKKISQDLIVNQKWLSTKILESLKEFMGDEMIQLLEMFEQETPSIIRKINVALKNKDNAEVQKMAHMLKSTSANIGANGLSFFSRKMEVAADTKQIEHFPVIFNKIQKSYVLTSKEISKYIQLEKLN